MRSRLIKALNNRFYVKFMQLEISLLAMYKIIALKFVAFEYSYLTILTIIQREEAQTSEPRVTVRYTLNGRMSLISKFCG